MPTFQDPDIDPALTTEAQAVVDDAAASMKQWLNQRFDDIEANAQKELDQSVQELEQLAERFAQEDAERDAALKETLNALGEAAKNLTELDEDQRKVMEQLAEATKTVTEELAARTARWQGLGTKAVQVTGQVVKKAFGGIF